MKDKEKIEVEDRSGRDYLAKMRILVDVNVKCTGVEGLMSPAEAAEFLEQVNKMCRPMVNAQGATWHIEEMVVDTFPPSKDMISSPHRAMLFLFQAVKSLEIWSGQMGMIHGPMGWLGDTSKDLKDIGDDVKDYVTDMAFALDNNEEIKEHVKTCERCRDFFKQFKREHVAFLALGEMSAASLGFDLPKKRECN